MNKHGRRPYGNIKCIVCGREFFHTRKDNKGSKKQTCSTVCQHEYRLDYMKKWRAKQTGVDK